MQTRVLGRTGLQVGIVGMGGIPIVRCTHDEGVALYRQAMDRGISYFDAARGYTNCENRLGPAVQGRRENVVIASKTTRRDAEGMLADIDESLRVLGTDYVDIYKCHIVCQFDELEKCLGPGGAVEGLMKAKEQGKIRHTGISGHNSDVLIEAVKTGLFDVILVIFNYMNTQPAEQLLPLCRDLGVGVTIMKPFGGSVLAQQTDLALRWVLQHEGVSVACPGMWRPMEVEANAGVGEEFRPLSDAEMQQIADQRMMRSPMHCRLCYRHIKCPNGINLDELMISDLNYTRFGMEMMMERGWDALVEATSACFGCGTEEECRCSCGYGVDIPRYMRHVYTTYMPLIREWRATHQ